MLCEAEALALRKQGWDARVLITMSTTATHYKAVYFMLDSPGVTECKLKSWLGVDNPIAPED